ncbi:MAG: hypothetical protein ACKOCB_05755 [Planctomycetia bacterium]
MSDPEPFLRAFFGEGNRSSQARQAPWVEMLRRGREAVLPRALSAQDGQLYCLAPTAEALDRLLGIVRANLGSRWVQGEGSPGWDPRDAFDARLARHAMGVYEGGALFVRRVRLAREHLKPAADALERLAALLRDAPPRASRDEQGLAALLREVRVGVAAGIHGRHDVDRALQALLEQGHLSAINVDFLRTWAWAEMGRYRELLDDGAYDRSKQVSLRPRLVTQAIAKAVWATYLEAPCATQPLDKVVAHYKGTVEPRHSAVLEAFRAQDGWLADACRVLHGLAFDEERLYRPAAEALASAAGAPAGLADRVRQEVARRAPAAVPLSPAALVAAGSFDAAVECLRQQPPSVETARLLLACAAHVDSACAVLQAWREGLEAGLETRLRAQVPSLARIWDAASPAPAPAVVEAPAAGLPPATTWLEWLERAAQGLPERDLRDLPFVHATAGVRALVSQGLEPGEAADRLHDLLGSTFTPSVERMVQERLPEMVGAWTAWQAPDLAKAKVADAITLYAAASDLLGSWPPPQFHAYCELLEARLGTVMGAEAYQAAVESLGCLVGEKASRQSVERAIDCAEILVDKACGDSTSRAGFLDRLVAKASAMAYLLDEAAKATLSAICRSLGLSGLPADLGAAAGGASRVAERPAASLARAGKVAPGRLRIGAYTLEKPAGQRFKKLAEQQYAVEVVLNHDHVETNAIQSLGKLDAVIVVTRRAKHAATDALGRYVHKDKLCYADGGGTSSMLRALEGFLGASA